MRFSSIARVWLMSVAVCSLIGMPESALAAPHGMNFGRKEGKDLEPDAGKDALRQIVQQQCVVGWMEHQSPAPCDRVYLADPKNPDSGYAILADKKGAAHYLL